ncbi:uncharacterized protein MKZ38_001537 [Zalerion maritima]|uniref:Uncharacterized protein n=1 Tax=Zalerion maritima TaxID=339359 RepID=A0AAD5WRG4_9PEZI|nr:uncharacterized protein MKZ38_001537 [Zalerion maritima]
MAAFDHTQAEVEVMHFCHQALQLEQHLDFPNGRLLRHNGCQDLLFRYLFSDKILYPLPPRYRLRILKQLVAEVEASIEDWDEHGISDNLMNSISELLASPLPSEAVSAQQKCYVTYHLSLLRDTAQLRDPYPSITLLESRSLISGLGTTGLRTWEAALHLGQYLCRSPDIIKGRRVLELGAGTGYLAILCAKYLNATQVIASDGSPDVTNFIPENFFLNFLEGSGGLSAMDLKWGHAIAGAEEEEWNAGDPIDVVLGADITYDESTIPALVATLLELFSHFPSLGVLISATERNKTTYESFLRVCRLRALSVTGLEFEMPTTSGGPFYSNTVPIRICRIARAVKSPT